MPRGLKIFLKTLLGLFILVALVLGGYVLYLQAHWERLADNEIVRIEGSSPETKAVELDTTYTAMTYNIGFGAYTPSFSFFMESGIMADGTVTHGERGKAVGEESVVSSTEGAIKTAATIVVPAEPEPSEDDWDSWYDEPAEEQPAEPTSADFMLFQEVDTGSDRSYHVDQKALIKAAFPSYAAYYASNFHSGFLALPLHDMHGRVNSGLLTLTNVAPESVIRRRYPIDESFPGRYSELDRCFTIMRLPIAGKDADLVLINSHMSAYDAGGTIRGEQLSMLNAVLTTERANGNYVIAGGDWNHALCNSQEMYPSDQKVPDRIVPLNEDELPQGFAIVRAQNIEQVPTCRSSDIPYQAGHTYTVTIDGFMVSDNVEATATNVDTSFAYSNHNPVLLSFTLKDAA